MDPKIRLGMHLSLLLVEDETGARDVLARMLASDYPHLRLLVAGNGAEGLELFRQHTPEIVMTDINMPVMNGIAMARMIKDMAPETSVIAVTSNSAPWCLLEAIEIGIHHYVLKPVNYQELLGVLDKVLEKITLKRLVEVQFERIRRREHQLSQVQKITHLGSWEWDLANGQVAWSDELYRILGLDPESVAASCALFLEMVHPADREAFRIAVQQARDDLHPVNSLFFRIVRPDGLIRIMRGQLEVVLDVADGSAVMIGICHDITKQKSAEAALRASERRFFKIFQATPGLLSITGLQDGKFLEVNKAFLQALGYQRSEVVGRSVTELRLWADEQQRLEVARALEERGEVRNLEVRFQSKAGRELLGLISLEPIEMHGNQYVLTLFKDISERKRLEEDRARLAAIVESSDDAIIAADAEGAITNWNQGAEHIFGYTVQEASGRHLSFLVAEGRKDEITRLHQSIRDDARIAHFETVHVRKDGRNINVSLTMSPLKNAAGAIVGTSCIARDVTERTEMEELIKHQAQHDALTDLPNRKLFRDFLNQELSQARRNKNKLAVLFLDLDHFKQINDTLGHAAGDLLLQAVAQRLRGCVRESDIVARIGGDEFNVLMPELTQNDAVVTVVDKIMGVFGTPFLLDNLEVYATTSIGISVFPEDGDSSEDLVQKADTAMYVAKLSSGNSYRFYSADINKRTVSRRRMEHLLREAPLSGGLELEFQPQVRIDTGRIVGAEALLRWRHPELGLLQPSQFLALAEETGTIVPIGEWVIRNACAQMKRWQKHGYDFTVTVNLSDRQFHQPDLLEMIARALAETGLNGQALELDVTEKSIMDNLDYSLSNMRSLTGMGVTFSVNDFGVGASSLKWIKQLPIGRLKIDKSFIKDILTDPNDLVVVRAVISMSHNLKMKVNAVGIESDAQLTLIRDFGCDEMQGYLVSKPLPASGFRRLVAHR